MLPNLFPFLGERSEKHLFTYFPPLQKQAKTNEGGFCVFYLNSSFFCLKYTMILPGKVPVCTQRTRRSRKLTSQVCSPSNTLYCVFAGRADHLLLLLEEDPRGGELARAPAAPAAGRVPQDQNPHSLHPGQHPLQTPLQRVL